MIHPLHRHNRLANKVARQRHARLLRKAVHARALLKQFPTGADGTVAAVLYADAVIAAQYPPHKACPLFHRVGALHRQDARWVKLRNMAARRERQIVESA